MSTITNLELSIRGILRSFGLKLARISKCGFEDRVQELAAANVKLQAAATSILGARNALRIAFRINENKEQRCPTADAPTEF